MKVLILSPEKVLFSGKVNLIRLPGAKGRFEVMPHHAPIISTLDAGNVECEGPECFAAHIKSGFVEIVNDVATICVEENDVN